ncbi:uncharacterized protein [Triticum aestivum]|uniref:uncharacterized protein n=1 Tax=Triticum aestivum TaxID=4565 RepID=UPI001D013DEA|nr:uncharacterized protein LOC123164009 [Triticum aestivum]
MEGKEAPAPVISAVLEDDDLLGEILLRVAFPTSLVRAALVFGVNSWFLFWEWDGVLYLFDIKGKEAKKVYEVTQEDRYIHGVRPFMMVWPPKFPMMKEGYCDPKE